jgi:protein-tyrosine phosphatase
MSTPIVNPLLSRRRFLRGSAHVVLASGFGTAILSACGGGSATDEADSGAVAAAAVTQMASVENFRDVAGGGDGYPTTDGHRVRRGLLYRSGAFTPNAADLATAAKLGIAVVYDLRTRSESAADPDRLPAGAIGQQIEIAPMAVANQIPDSADAALAYMMAAERSMTGDVTSRMQFGVLLTRLATTSGVQVFNDGTGKDRAGWAAAILLGIAGVPLDVIMQDYMLTNTVAAGAIQARMDALGRRTDAAVAANSAALFQAEPAVLQAGFDQLQASFGTLDAYVTQGLGVERSAVDLLRAKLVA